MPLQRHTPRHAPALLAALVAFTLTGWAAAQDGEDHTLYGDFKIEGSAESEAGAPATYSLLLYQHSGRLVGRQNVVNNGRYRFLAVPNGEYDLVVEADGQEVARMRLQLAYSYSTDHRHDVALQARAAGPDSGAGAQSVSAAHLYRRKGSAAALFDRAEQAFGRKDYAHAALLFGQVVEADPKDFPAWARLGTAHFARQDHAEAERAYLRALGERPDFVPVLVNLGRVRMARKDFAGAVEPLGKAVEAQPASASAQFLLGETYLQLKKGSKAVPHLNEAARLGRAEAHLRLATLYNAVGLKDRAAAEYEQFLAKEPKHPDAERMRRYVAENKKQ